jgi:tetratricopeptide (TPR) repeat protein
MSRLSPRDAAKLRRYETLLEREPNALVFAPLASLYARQYDFQKAVVCLKQGLAIYPNYFSARVLLARCYIALDDFEFAVSELEKVLSADPYNVSALGLLGDELRNRGRLAEARDHYLKILEIEPENEEYSYKLELLSTLIEGSPFARESEEEVPAEVEELTPPEAEIELPPTEELEPAELELVEEVDEVADVAALAVDTADEGPADEELATLTLARIYEDQGLFVRAMEIIEKVVAREPANAAARDALAHISALIASEESPSGASVLQLIQKVEAVSGLLERDEIEMWEEVSAGVEDALAGHEEITLAQAVAAATGITSHDRFVIQSDHRAAWELDLPGFAAAMGEGGAEEMQLELPLTSLLDMESGINIAELAAQLSLGEFGTDEIEVRPARVDRMEVAEAVAGDAGASGRDDFSLDLKARISGRPAEETEPPAVEEPPPARDEFAVQPERYQARKPLELEREPFKKDEDFLGWLDSIRLKEL